MTLNRLYGVKLVTSHTYADRRTHIAASERTLFYAASNICSFGVTEDDQLFVYFF